MSLEQTWTILESNKISSVESWNFSFLDSARPESVDVNSLMMSSARVLNGYHVCIICNKACLQRATMLRHMQEVHVKCEQYWCPSCCVVYSSRVVFSTITFTKCTQFFVEETWTILESNKISYLELSLTSYLSK